VEGGAHAADSGSNAAGGTFAVCVAIGLVAGFALYGSVTYLPAFLQVVKGSSPTQSGLQLAPMMVGVLASSVVSGQLVTRTGRYKIFPVLGTATVTVALFHL
jgi:cyanate permease